ncbi:MAG: hypothetical protein ACLSVD_07445 [Eggerthellaceae bacterium]
MAQVNGRARPEADGSTLAQLLERDGFSARVACRAEQGHRAARRVRGHGAAGRRRAGSGPLREAADGRAFSRIGEEARARLAAARVGVAGLGGLGRTSP